MSIPKHKPNKPGALLDHKRMAHICKALGHPIRIRILQHLQSSGNCKCGEIVALLPLAQSTVSQHLKYLRDAGLITCETAGPSTSYCLNRDMFTLFEESFNRIFEAGGQGR